MLFGSLNSADILQKKSPNKCLLPSGCPFCLKANETLLHLFLLCPFSSLCWSRLFSILNIAWVFDGSLSSSILQLLEGPSLPKKSRLIWLNLSKALLAELWFERNQWIFLDKERPRPEIFPSTKRNAAAWCSLNKEFGNYSIQDICLNWAVSNPLIFVLVPMPASLNQGSLLFSRPSLELSFFVWFNFSP